MPLFECSTMTTTPRNRALSTQLCEIHLKTTFVSIERLHTELMLAFADATHVIFPKTRMPSSVHFNRSSSTLPKGPQFLNGSSLLETREALGHAIRNLLTQAVKDVGILQLIDEFVGQSQRTGCAGHTTWRKTAPSQHKPVRGIVANLQGDSAAFVRITKPLTACGAPHATWLLRPSFRLAIIIHIEQTDAASGSSATRLTCVHCGEGVYVAAARSEQTSRLPSSSFLHHDLNYEFQERFQLLQLPRSSGTGPARATTSICDLASVARLVTLGIPQCNHVSTPGI